MENDNQSWIDVFLGFAAIAALAFFYYASVILAGS